MTADTLRAEYDAQIDRLRADLVTVEDTADSGHRSYEIRAKIRELQYERDLIPRQER